MKVEVLYVSACPSLCAAVGLVKEVLAVEGGVTHIHQLLVRDENMASELKFLGSPAIRIKGRDIAVEARTVNDFAVSCRLCPESNQIGLPPREIVHRAVSEAREGEIR